MVWPAAQEGGVIGLAKASEAHQHAALPIAGQAQPLRQLDRIEAGPGTGDADRNAGHAPVHRQREGAVQQQIPLGVELPAALGALEEGATHRGIDGIPAEARQPHQRQTQPPGQLRRGRGHIPEHQSRFSLGREPGRLLRQSTRQLAVENLQGCQGARFIAAEGIGLHHPHIPLTGPVFERHRSKGQLEKGGRQTARHHQAPIGPESGQFGEHRCRARSMAEAVTAQGRIDQHRSSTGGEGMEEALCGLKSNTSARRDGGTCRGAAHQSNSS